MGILDVIEDIDINKIEVSDMNIRHHSRDENIEELAASILEYGLLQPIVVKKTESESKFELIVGQRRFLAHKYLLEKGKLEIPEIKSVVLEKDTSPIFLKILSLAENLHRVEVSYEDKSRTIKELYDYYSGNIKKVAKNSGFSESTIKEYLKIDELGSEKTKRLLVEGKISKEDAKRAIYASGSDWEKQDKLVDLIQKYSAHEKDRLVRHGRENPEATIEELEKEAVTPRLEPTVVLNLSKDVHVALNDAAVAYEMDRELLAMKALREWLEEEGFMKK